MPATTTIFRAARPVFQSAASRTTFQQATMRNLRFAGRRFNSTAAGETPAAEQSWFKRMWDSPVGIKTVHFWAPIMKWAIVIAGVGDFFRPAEKLSLTQNGALMATGTLWTRWCFVITPRNMLLAAVNFFLAIVGTAQVTRILMWRSSQKELPAQAEAEAEKVAEEAKKVAEKAKDAVKS